MKNLYWMMRRIEKRAAFFLIERLISHYKWHNSVLDTNIPNVPFLRVKKLTVVNGYGQEREIVA